MLQHKLKKPPPPPSEKGLGERKWRAKLLNSQPVDVRRRVAGWRERIDKEKKKMVGVGAESIVCERRDLPFKYFILCSKFKKPKGKRVRPQTTK